MEHNDDEFDKGKGVLDEEAYFLHLSDYDDNKYDSDGWINFAEDDEPEFIDVREGKKGNQKGNCS